MRLLFVTDLHGGNKVFLKSLQLWESLGADFLLIGGDIAGKYLVPMIAKNNSRIVSWNGKVHVLESDDAIREYVESVAGVGGYAVTCSTEEADRLRSDNEYREEVLRRERISRLRDWLGEVNRRLEPAKFLINLGNDDPFYLDGEIVNATGYEILEARNILLSDGFEIVSCGYTNLTPWNCPRDCSEEELWLKISGKLAQCRDSRRVIANFHCPPRFSHLDRAPRLDADLRPIVGANGVEYEHVGSSAVRRAVEEFSPAVGLHGHIHEAYAKEIIGSCICVNPGSTYHTGDLRAALVHFGGGRIKGVQLVRER